MGTESWKNHNTHPWETYSAELKVEKLQCAQEGMDISALETLFDAVIGLPEGSEKEKLADTLFEMLCKAPRKADYPYVEPSDAEGIRKARPANAPVLGQCPEDSVLWDRIYGAWLGRVCGCLLGKPVEGWRTPALHAMLKAQDNFPLHQYIRYDKAYFHEKRPGLIDTLPGYAPSDDDTNYTAMAAKCLLEDYGRDFTPENVADMWQFRQPRTAYCTAERRAYHNFSLGIYPPQSAVYQNPYREWIGAQIRGDYFGYINPGDPETAADMAWRDASISHVKNGIYGEMFAAAMIAAAAVCDDISTVIRAGLAQIPEKCRLTEDIGKVLTAYDDGKTKEEVFALIHTQWNEFEGHDWCHTNSNAMIVAAALLYGGGDYGKSICMAVETGFDTDCNGATVGSVLGMIHGSAGIPTQWREPIHDTVDTSIIGVGTMKLSDLADLAMKHRK